MSYNDLFFDIYKSDMRALNFAAEACSDQKLVPADSDTLKPVICEEMDYFISLSTGTSLIQV
jgi:hypothetical protein